MRRTLNITTNPAEIRIPANQTEFESELPVGGNVDSVGVVVTVVVVVVVAVDRYTHRNCVEAAASQMTATSPL